jgi:hypothetical protein
MKTNDGYISENRKHLFRHCKELGLYMQQKKTLEVIRSNLTDKEFKSLCYGLR